MLTEIGIVMGTSNTAVYVPGDGIVLFEPTAVSFAGDSATGRVKAAGKAAAEMRGRTPERTSIVFPVQGGVIRDKRACYLMLKTFLAKLFKKNPLRKIKAVVGVPVGISVEERKAFEDVAFDAGISECVLVENIMLSAIGIDLPVHSHRGCFIINIGGGVTEIAAISLSGIVSGVGINVGGDMIDGCISDKIMGITNLKCGITTIKKLKNNLASLYSNDISRDVVSGVDISTSSPASTYVTANEITEAILPYYLRVADAASIVIKGLKPELCAEMTAEGIHVVGGSAGVAGLDKLLATKLNLPVSVYPNGMYANIIGCGKLLSSPLLMKDLLMQR